MPPIADHKDEVALVRRQVADTVAPLGVAASVEETVLDARVTAFRDLRVGRSAEGWVVEKPGAVLSTAEAVGVAWLLALDAAWFPERHDALSLVPGYLLGVVMKDDPKDRGRLLVYWDGAVKRRAGPVTAHPQAATGRVQPYAGPSSPSWRPGRLLRGALVGGAGPALRADGPDLRRVRFPRDRSPSEPRGAVGLGGGAVGLGKGLSRRLLRPQAVPAALPERRVGGTSTGGDGCATGALGPHDHLCMGPRRGGSHFLVRAPSASAESWRSRLYSLAGSRVAARSG